METSFEDIYNKRKNLHDALKENNSGLLELVQDLYPEITHFIFEILQNAEDAKATEISFLLTQEKLEIVHNGQAFTITDIGGITNIAGRHNEKKEKNDKIGRFGIGFKSVYAITNKPRIQSGNYDFEIQDYILPVNFSNENNYEKTIITLPFKGKKLHDRNVYDLIIDKFQSLEHFNLLFLNYLTKIELKAVDFLKNIKKEYESPIKGSSIAYKTIISLDKTQHEYLLFKDDVKQNAFSRLKTKPKIAIAFKQDLVEGKKQIVQGDTSKLFVFFKTEYETFLKFMIQAPFITTPSRDNVKFEESINIQLLEEVIELTKKAMEFISLQKLISVDFLNQLPIDNTIDKKELVYWRIFQTVKEELLSGKKYFPITEGKLLASSNAVGLIRGKELKQILASKLDLQQLFKIDHWLDAKITIDRTPQLRNYLMKELLIKEYGPDDFAKVVTKEFFESKPNSWFRAFYGFLNGKQQSLYSVGKGKDEGILRKKPFIRLSNGKNTEPFDIKGKPKVFLSAPKKKVPYDTIHPETISNKPSMEFIKEKLGLKVPDLIDEIGQHIIPLYKNIPDAKFPSDKVHLDHMDFIIDVYDKGKDSLKTELIELLTSENTYFFNVVELGTGKSFYGRGDHSYFYDEDLAQYFRFTSNVYFLNEKYYKSLSINIIREIATKCGFINYPRSIPFDPKFSEEKKKQLRLQSYYNSEEITWNQPWYVNDTTLKGLPEIMKQDDLANADSLLIWKMILKNLRFCDNKEDLFKGTYTWFRNSIRFTYFSSQLLLDLRSKKWLFNTDGDCCRPNEMTLANLSDDYDKISEEARLLIDKLQFKSEAEDEYLNQIPADKRNELLEAAELIRLSKETGIDYKTLLQQKIGEEKRAEYQSELDAAPSILDIDPIEQEFEGFDNSGIDVEIQEDAENTDPKEDSEKETTPKIGKDSDNQMPQDIKNKIGYRGERVVWKTLKKKWSKKMKLLYDSECEMEFQNTEGENFKIIHLNESDKKGIGCDILIKQGEEIHKYIEVKSTKNNKKEYYSVSGFQWALAHKNYNLSNGNKYSIYVVQDVLAKKPKVIPIENPIKKWKEGKLRANPVNIQF